MKTMKKWCSLLMVALLLPALCAQPAFARGASAASAEGGSAPSERFVELYTKLLAGEETYELYDADGNCITQAFVAEYSDADFQTMWEAVLEGHYVLKFGTTTVTQPASGARATINTRYVQSEYGYFPESLDELVTGKVIDYFYRVSGEYTLFNGKINTYNPPQLEIIMSDPGSGFSYTTNKTNSVTVNASGTQITFKVDFRFTFTYAPLGKTQTTQLRTASVTGTA